jgi:hypothetical protein
VVDFRLRAGRIANVKIRTDTPVGLRAVDLCIQLVWYRAIEILLPVNAFSLSDFVRVPVTRQPVSAESWHCLGTLPFD